MSHRPIGRPLTGSLVIVAITSAVLAGCCRDMAVYTFAPPSLGVVSSAASDSTRFTARAAPVETRPLAAEESAVKKAAVLAPAHPAPSGSPELGARVYAQRCAICHGSAGEGNGPAASGLNPRPRNHTDGAYMNGRTDAQLLAVIRNGKGAMPAWKGVLSEPEIRAVLVHVRSLAVPPYRGSSGAHRSVRR